jgi:hypothetical protein
MGPPSSSSASATAAAQAPKRRRRRAGVPVLDSETGQYTLQVRAAQKTSRTLLMTLSEPVEDEECSITLAPIREYRLPFMPEDEEAPNCVVEGAPQLAKASLPCGHGFNAMALLYHFVKNSMTCPICRAGHAQARMAEQSVPPCARKHFAEHLASLRVEETQEQIAADAMAAARMLEIEVSRISHAGFMPMTRIVLILYAFDTMDVWRRDSPGLLEEPVLALELPLTSSLSLGTLEFVSSGYSLAQLNLNLLRLPTPPRGFEVGVGVQSLLHGNMLLFRTVRFPSTGALHRVVFARDSMPPEHLAIEVLTMAGVLGLNTFYQLRWSVPVGEFSSLMLLSASRNAGGLVAAV